MTLRATPRSLRDAALVPGPRDNLAPGQLLGDKYRIEAHLAEGGMGVVLRATHLDLDCPVAIKLIRPEHTENEDVIARLLTEARIAAGLRSKHVNRVLDVGRTKNGLPYLVLEHLEGSDLSCYLERRGQLQLGEAVDWVMQTCEALAEAHAFGIVHRDLKPDNLFLSEEADGGFVLKVLDFGISKAPASRSGGRSLTNPFEVVGSPSYMSPEQVRGASVDSRADIWALGILLHELISGEAPFITDSITSTFALILDPGYSLPPLDVGASSEQVNAIVRKCMQREPEQRYQSVVELAMALAPLGTDAHQARRVAKVADASRARVIATSDTLTLANPGTPLALSRHYDEAELDDVEFRPRNRTRNWLVGAGALLAISAGAVLLGASAHRGSAEPAPPLRQAAAAPIAADRVESTPPVTTVGTPVAVGEATPQPPAKVPQKQPTVPWRAPRQAGSTPAKPRAEVSPVVAVSVAAPTRQPAVEAPPPKRATPALTTDAWDTNAFGGRR